MVKIADASIRVEGAYYNVKIDYMQREKHFRLTLPDELAKFFNFKYVTGDTEDEVTTKTERMVEAYIKSNQSPVEKVISYKLDASLWIKNPINGYVITKIDVGHPGSDPSIGFDFKVGYRQEMPNPQNLSDMKTVYFTYYKGMNDREMRESWSPDGTVIPWTQETEDFFTAFKQALERLIVNIFTFLDKPYPELKKSIDATGKGTQRLLMGPLEDQWFPSHQEGWCTKCMKQLVVYTNLKGDRQKRCRECGTTEPLHKDDVIAQRLMGATLPFKPVEEKTDG